LSSGVCVKILMQMQTALENQLHLFDIFAAI
jgi:hypothetical protein